MSHADDATADHPLALPGGTMLNEYRIESVLGQGGFGITYLAWDTLLDERVAIKEYFPGDNAVRTQDLSARARTAKGREVFRAGLTAFLDEARIIARFRHTNIMQVRRFFEERGTGYIVLNYEAGRSLEDLMTEAPLPEEGVLSIMDGILRGLEVVHERAVLHRDLKPRNVVVREDGTPVLLDFGAARDFGLRNSFTVTQVASSGYSPPEQYGVGDQHGPWSDLYALGGIAYRGVTGRAPVDALSRLRDDPLVPATKAAAGLYGAALLRTIDSMMRIDETKRPVSVADVRRRLPALDGARTVPLSSFPGHPMSPPSQHDWSRKLTRSATRARSPWRLPGTWWIGAPLALVLAGTGCAYLAFEGPGHVADPPKATNALPIVADQLPTAPAVNKERAARNRSDTAASKPTPAPAQAAASSTGSQRDARSSDTGAPAGPAIELRNPAVRQQAMDARETPAVVAPSPEKQAARSDASRGPDPTPPPPASLQTAASLGADAARAPADVAGASDAAAPEADAKPTDGGPRQSVGQGASGTRISDRVAAAPPAASPVQDGQASKAGSTNRTGFHPDGEDGDGGAEVGFTTDAIPYVSPMDRLKVALEYAHGGEKALVLSPDGKYGAVAGQESSSQAQDQAMQLCTRAGGVDCQPYAIDDRVVSPGLAPEAVFSLLMGAPIPGAVPASTVPVPKSHRVTRPRRLTYHAQAAAAPPCGFRCRVPARRWPRRVYVPRRQIVAAPRQPTLADYFAAAFGLRPQGSVRPGHRSR